MRREDRLLRDYVASLDLGSRVGEWLAVMRRAGGLGFEDAGEERKSEIFEIEQTTPESDRTRFREARDSILGFNALCTWVCSGYRLHADALLSRVGMLLSLMTMAGSKDTCDLLGAAADGAPPAASPSRKKRASGAGASLGGGELVAELALYAGAALAHDDAPTRAYWAEVLGGGPVGLAASAQVDLKALLRGKGEPIERAIAHYLSPLVALASAPRDVAERLAPRVGREGDHDAGLDPVLTPTDAYLQWGDDLSGMLRSSRLVQRFVPDPPPVGDLSFLEKLMDNPRSHMVPERVIGAYEYWLYNHKKSRKGELLHKLVWRPWQDYLAVPIVRRVEELVEEYERIHGRKPPPPWRRTLGGRAGNDPE